MNAVVEACFTAIKLVMAVFLAVMVVLVFGNVVLRYGFNSGITVSDELSRWLFVWMTFLGAVVAVREHAHLGIDTLVKRLPPGGRRACAIASLALMLYGTSLFLVGSWKQTLLNWDTDLPATGLPAGLLYAAGIVFSIPAGILFAVELYRVVTGRTADSELVLVKESEEQDEIDRLQHELAPAPAKRG